MYRNFPEPLRQIHGGEKLGVLEPFNGVFDLQEWEYHLVTALVESLLGSANLHISSWIT